MRTLIIKVDPGELTGGKGSSLPGRIAPAVRAIRAGKLVVFPTETVYGVGVVASDAAAVGRLRELKGRPDAPFTVHLPSPEHAERYVRDVPLRARTLMSKALPGPVTILLPARGRFAHPSLRGKTLHRRLVANGVVGLRCPDDAVAQALLSRTGTPVLATSANLAGSHAPTCPEEVLEQLDSRVDVLIDAGRTRYRKGSTIVAFEGERFRTVRTGVYDASDIERLSRRRILFVCTGNTCRSPMAAALAGKLLSERIGCEVHELGSFGQEISSAGSFAFSGGRATPEAVAAAARLGAVIRKHRARKLTGELINSSDLIFCMTNRHVADMVRAGSGAAGKTFLLDPDGDIADPVGGDVDAYLQVARRLERKLRKRMKENLL